MKLLVIVISLIMERFLIHQMSFHRLSWFNKYSNVIGHYWEKNNYHLNAFLRLAIIVAPATLVAAILLYLFKHWLFGFVGLFINIFIFYYCLGPENPFYPRRVKTSFAYEEEEARNYLVKVNSQLFAVVFWYSLGGPIMLLLYRLISLCQLAPATAEAAQRITAILEWIPARITLLFYLLVGNFQRGFPFYLQKFTAMPEDNALLLSEGGILAAKNDKAEQITMPYAETLVEHALVIYLVLLAFVTLIAVF